MINLLDYLSLLTAADSRSGQNRLVSAIVQTLGYETVVGGLSGNSSSYKAAEIIGIIQDTATVSVKSSAGKIIKVAYTKIQLQEPYTTTSNELVSYLWFPTTQVQFADQTDKPVIPVTSDNRTLSPVYSEAPAGITVRQTASTLAKKVKLVSYGDIAGYTDGTEKKYLTYTFWQLFDQKGRAIGWCAKGKGFSSLTKPQAKALPKYDAKGETTQDYSTVTNEQDPQAGNSSGVNIWKIVAWVFGIVLVLWLGIRALTKKTQKQLSDGN